MGQSTRQQPFQSFIGKFETEVRADVNLQASTGRDVAHLVQIWMRERIAPDVERNGCRLALDLIDDPPVLRDRHALFGVELNSPDLIVSIRVGVQTDRAREIADWADVQLYDRGPGANAIRSERKLDRTQTEIEELSRCQRRKEPGSSPPGRLYEQFRIHVLSAITRKLAKGRSPFGGPTEGYWLHATAWETNGSPISERESQLQEDENHFFRRFRTQRLYRTPRTRLEPTGSKRAPGDVGEYSPLLVEEG